MQRRVQRRCGVIAAALVERAAQRTLGFAEGSASKPRQGTALGPAALVACKTGLRQAQPERKGCARPEGGASKNRRGTALGPAPTCRTHEGFDRLSPNGEVRGFDRLSPNGVRQLRQAQPERDDAGEHDGPP